jgi:hypothetical protein
MSLARVGGDSRGFGQGVDDVHMNTDLVTGSLQASM